MYRNSFPKCTIKGERTPTPFDHGPFKGMIPVKCSNCTFLLEGECMRAIEASEDYLRLDYPSCSVQGSSTPILFKKEGDENEHWIPQKCNDCRFLNPQELTCKENKEVWGHYERDLDWGNWEPDYPLIGLRRIKTEGSGTTDLGPAIITKQVIELITLKKDTAALKLYRTLNKIEFIKEAKLDIEKIKTKLAEITRNTDLDSDI